MRYIKVENGVVEQAPRGYREGDMILPATHERNIAHGYLPEIVSEPSEAPEAGMRWVGTGEYERVGDEHRLVYRQEPIQYTQDGFLVPKTTLQSGGSEVSRKEFLCLAMLGAVGAARPRLTRGPLIAMKRGRKSPSPYHGYISNGLISYWDGIDNTGNGDSAHDSSAVIWVNLVADSAFGDFQLNEYHSFGEDCARFSPPIGTHGGVAQTPSVMMPSIGTWEMVAKDNESKKSEAGLFSDDLNIGATGIYQGQFFKYIRNGIGNINQTRRNVSVSCDGTDVATYIAGGIDNTVSVTPFTPGSHRLRFGRYYGTAEASVEICAFRLYDRALTVAEIAANYAIDRARFGLA